MDPQQGRLFYLITYPRVASNLLVKILSVHDQPDVITNDVGGGYFFLPAFLLGQKHKLRDKQIDEWSAEEKDQMKSAYQEAVDKLESFVQRAKTENKVLFVKEHAEFMADPTKLSGFAWENHPNEPAWRLQLPQAYGSPPSHSSLNDTLLPDDFLRQWRPVFLIRHPALVFPSLYRAMTDSEGFGAAEEKREPFNMGMTLRWSRRLYDLYTTLLPSSSPWPTVIDADDVINEPQVLIRLCRLMGLDETKMQFSWEQVPESQREHLAKTVSPMVRRMMSTLWASEGIMKDKTPKAEAIDVEVEAAKWRKEFGESEGRQLEEWVRKALPDYEFLRGKRLMPETDTIQDEIQRGASEESKKASEDEAKKLGANAPSKASKSQPLSGLYKVLQSLGCMKK
ncbi:MAG: hypothetical protein Q9227_007809 [Pyrenula ochraceoflavens]